MRGTPYFAIVLLAMGDFAGESAELCQLFMKNSDMDRDTAIEVCQKLNAKLRLTSIDMFLHYFQATPLVDFWKNVPEWNGVRNGIAQGSILAQMRIAHIKLVKADKQSQADDDVAMDAAIDQPIDPRTNKSLTVTWRQHYGYDLHPTQEATHQILGSLYRALQLRQIKAEPVRGLHTLESTQGIEPKKKIFKIGDLKLLTDADNDKKTDYSHKANPFLFICGLEVMMRTLCKAGTYYVADPEDDCTDAEKLLQPKVLNIERECIEEHLAQCRAFAVEWSTKAHPPSMAAITQQMTRI